MDLKWEIGISLLFQENIGVEQLEILEKSEIRYFEFDSFPPCFDQEDENAMREIKGYLKNSQLKCWSLHSIFNDKVDFSRFSGKDQDDALNSIRRSIDLAANLGTDKVIVHPNYGDIPEKEKPGRIFHCREGLGKLVGFAKGLGIKLAVENLAPQGLGTSQEILGIVSDFDPEIIGICVDVNHILKEKIDDFIRKVGERIISLHISDNDGLKEQHWLPMEGVIDWQNLLIALCDINYSGVFMYEAVPEVEEFKGKIEAIEENYEKLMKIA